MSLNQYKIAFIGWNPFQFIQIKELAMALPNAIFILEKKKNNISSFSLEILNNSDVPISILSLKELENIDGEYDIVIAQTVFPYIENLVKTKLVMLQYSYAKEPHQYGSWRALSKLTLTYGSYAQKKISYFTPAVAVGNPRFDLWSQDTFHQDSKKKYKVLLDDNKKTLLYMPTWGALSSLDLFLNAVLELSENYNLLIKVHHNTDLMEKGRVSIDKKHYRHYLGANDDSLALFSVADIVISDYSGAIFDAIFCKKPLILLDLDDKYLLEQKKMDKYSLEFVERDKLGTRVKSASMLLENIQNIEDNYDNEVSKLKRIREELFETSDSSIELAIETLENLMSGMYQKNQAQKYLEESIRSFYAKNSCRERVILFLKKYKLI